MNKKVNSDWQTIGFVKGNGTTNEPRHYGFTDIFNKRVIFKLFGMAVIILAISYQPEFTSTK